VVLLQQISTVVSKSQHKATGSPHQEIPNRNQQPLFATFMSTPRLATIATFIICLSVTAHGGNLRGLMSKGQRPTSAVLMEEINWTSEGGAARLNGQSFHIKGIHSWGCENDKE